MISKETSRKIYNCYQQIEAIEKTKSDILEEIERIRKKEIDIQNETPIPENNFGRYGKGLQMGIPDRDSSFSSMRIYNISPELGISVMDEQAKKLNRDLRELETIARLEMEAKNDTDRN